MKLFGRLKKLADDNDDDVMIRWMAAVECRQWNRNEQGVELYKQILEKWNPGPVLVHQTYANLLDQLKRYDEALVERKIAVKLEPAGYSYGALADTYSHMQRWDEANEWYAKAVEIQSDYAHHWCNWAGSLRREGNSTKRSKSARRLCKSRPSITIRRRLVPLVESGVRFCRRKASLPRP